MLNELKTIVEKEDDNAGFVFEGEEENTGGGGGEVTDAFIDDI